ncbi:MAG TPA: hypothetical protein VMY06_06495 [Sedimentisphaerales bacterium]|nr:hypothetical protein [Sedimentisphaerales bacterium]
MSMKSISELLYENKSSAATLRNYSYGIIQSFRAFLGSDSVAFSIKQQEVKKLPDGFKESITAQINKLLEDEDYTNIKDWLKHCIHRIDNYFDNL